MPNRSQLLTTACLVFAGAFATGAAQTPQRKAGPAKTPAAALTTSSGVYVAAQAARGEQTYMNTCVSCHPPGTYAAAAFRQKWNNAPLSQLFDLVSQTMPKNEPGSLEDEEYAQVIAYILKINGAPPGKTALPTDVRSLRRIRISMPPGKKK